MAKGDLVKIGGGLAFFDDSLDGFNELLDAGVDYIVCDYLAEVTMSFLALDKAGNPEGFSPLFLSDMRPYLKRIFDSGTKLVTNWGGLNPQGAAAALQALAKELGCNPRIGVCEGDNLAGRGAELRAKGLKDMFNGRPLPEDAGIGTMNAYLGGFPIAAVLDAGADVVITGRVVDSALTLGALIHEFGWKPGDHDLLAAGTLCGHLLECSTQTTGGTFTDWASVPGWENIGKPIAECRADGSFILTKPEGTGGLVSQGTVVEQMIYEVSDPQAYFVPDVVSDFSEVKVTEVGSDRVEVKGAKGYPATADYKVCTISFEGWRGQIFTPVIGVAAATKARRQAKALFDRTNRILRDRNAKPLNQGHIELIGAEASYGARSRHTDTREVLAMISVDHDEREGVEIFLKEQMSAASAMAPGCGMNMLSVRGTGAIPLMKLFSFLVPKRELHPIASVDGKSWDVPVETSGGFDPSRRSKRLVELVVAGRHRRARAPRCRLLALAWARSGDKGDLFNVGVFARRPEYAPYIAAALSAEAVRDWFIHFIDDGAPARVDRYRLPGSDGLNFVVHNSLDGGGSAGRRLDRLAKGMGQILLEFPIPVSPAIAEAASADQARREIQYAEVEGAL